MRKTRNVASLPASQAAGQGLDLDEWLRRAVDLLSAGRALELTQLIDRWRTRRFHALILGEFKRGKSTLLNALVGEDLLPTGVAPVTTVPTRVSLGPQRRALVRFRDGGAREIPFTEIREYVDESRNAGNRRDVASVDVELLAGPPPGVVLVDVPGLGSVHQHNTDTALAALPDADAAIVVASVDPPVGDAELRLLRAVRTHAARLDVVLNKIDYLDAEGRKAAEDFTRRVLAGEGLAGLRVWPVSARDGLRARLSGDDLAWRRSGMQALQEGLARFFGEERTAFLARSIARKAGRLVEQEAALLDIQRAGAERSAEQLSQVIEAFRDRLATAGRDASEDVLIFRRRLDAVLAAHSERAAEVWREPRSKLESGLREIVASHPAPSRATQLETMQSAARDAVATFVERFLPEQERRVSDDYLRLCSEIARAAAGRAESVWKLAADLFPFEPPRVEPPSTAPAPALGAFRLGSQHLLLDGLFDTMARLLPRGAALRRLAAQAMDEAEARYGQAVEQSRGTFSRGYEEHFRTVLAAYEDAIRQTTLALAGALEAALERAQALEAGRGSHQPTEEARRTTLCQLLAQLGRIERDEGSGLLPEGEHGEPV